MGTDVCNRNGEYKFANNSENKKYLRKVVKYLYKQRELVTFTQVK